MKRLFKEPQVTHAVNEQKAHSMFTRNAQITVQLNDFGTHARNMYGDIDCVAPDIKLTAEFIGEWTSKEKMDADMAACIEKLTSTYQHHISGNLLSNGQNQRGKDGY